MRRCSLLAKHAPLPAAVQRYLADQDAELRSQLVVNPHLSVEVAKAIFERRKNVHALVRFVRFTEHPELIDALAESGETRDKVVTELLHHWELSPESQRRLVEGGLSGKMASQLLAARWAAPDVALSLLTRAEPHARITWIREHEPHLDDSALADMILGACGVEDASSSACYELAGILHHRPAMRTVAARSRASVPVRAAAMVELSEADQGAVLAHWRAHLDQTALASIGVHLLDRTGTTQRHRDEAYLLLEEAGEGIRLADSEVPGAASPYPVGVPLVDVDDRRTLDLLLVRSSGMGWSARRYQWLDLTASPHLDAKLAERLAHHLQHEIAVTEALRHRFPKARIADRSRSLRFDQQQAARAGAYQASGTTVRIRREYDRQATSLLCDDPLVEGSGFTRQPFEGSPESAGEVLRSYLGEDLDAWRLCFDLLEEFEGRTSELGLLASTGGATGSPALAG